MTPVESFLGLPALNQRSGEPLLKEQPIFHFNLACDECQLGHRKAAKERLYVSLEIDQAYKTVHSHGYHVLLSRRALALADRLHRAATQIYDRYRSIRSGIVDERTNREESG